MTKVKTAKKNFNYWNKKVCNDLFLSYFLKLSKHNCKLQTKKKTKKTENSQYIKGRLMKYKEATKGWYLNNNNIKKKHLMNIKKSITSNENIKYLYLNI